jgi:hypothetical protein
MHMAKAVLLPDRDESDGHLENSEDDSGDDICGEVWLSHTGVNEIKVENSVCVGFECVTSRDRR